MKEHENFPVSDWKISKELGHTTLSYKEWVEQAIAEAASWGICGDDGYVEEELE